jgi:hypothetical protein
MGQDKSSQNESGATSYLFLWIGILVIAAICVISKFLYR